MDRGSQAPCPTSCRCPGRAGTGRHVAAAGVDQGLQVGLAPMAARLAPDQHAGIAGAQRRTRCRQVVRGALVPPLWRCIQSIGDAGNHGSGGGFTAIWAQNRSDALSAVYCKSVGIAARQNASRVDVSVRASQIALGWDGSGGTRKAVQVHSSERFLQRAINPPLLQSGRSMDRWRIRCRE